MFASSTRYIRSLIHKLPKRNFSLLDPEYYNKVYQENIDRDTMKLRKVSLRGNLFIIFFTFRKKERDL